MPKGALMSGRVAIVAGGGGEIGGAIASRYAAEGACVVVCDLSLEKAEAVAARIREAGGRAAALKVDVSQEEDCANAGRFTVETFGKVTDLVNSSATLSPDGNVEQLSTQAWRNALDVNFTGVFLMCKHTMGFIREAGGGAVVNIASSHGHFGLPGRSAYCSTKAALMHFTRVLAIDYGPHNIRANTISPGPINTARSLRRFGTREHANKERGRGQVLGRTGEVEEVAAAAVFLASAEASFITGTDLLVDGGQTSFKGTALSDIHQSAT